MQAGADKRGSVILNSTAKKIASLCDMHGVPFGSAGDLGVFMTALDENKHLAMDFWALVAKYNDSDSSPSANQSMLHAIVEGVTGQPAADLTRLNGDAERQVKELVSLLAGEDIHRPAATDSTAQDTPKSSTRPDVTAPGGGLSSGFVGRFNVKAVTIPLMTPLLPTASNPKPQSKPLPKKAAADASRLVSEPESSSTDIPSQRNTAPDVTDVNQPDSISSPVRVKTQDEILPTDTSVPDSRLEPLRVRDAESSQLVAKPVAAPKAKPSPASEPEPVRMHTNDRPSRVPLVTEEKSAPLAASEALPQEKTLHEHRVSKSARLVLEPERVRTADELRRADTSVRVPFGGFRSHEEPPTNHRKIVIAALLLIAAGGGAFFARPQITALWQEHKATVQARHEVGVQEPNDSGQPSSNNRIAAKGESPTGVIAGAPVARVAGERQSVPLTERGENYAPSSVTRQNDSNNQFARNSEPSGSATGEASAPLGEESGGPMTVFPAVMEDYLQSSRVPMYPEVARVRGVEGRVVMQAVITEDGTVGHLQVLEGDAALRSAATDAVSKWRYRPYLVNGKPVEVKTTVTVNFKLNQ